MKTNHSVKIGFSLAAITAVGVPLFVTASESMVGDDTIAQQRAALQANTEGAGFGPQSPRDIDDLTGTNARIFEAAPAYQEMNLCNIHMHEGAEHRGGEFTTFAGNGNGKGYGTGFLYSGTLTDAEKMATGVVVGESEYGGLVPGDTIEVHYVHSSAQVSPGPTLGACLSESIMNPQLRVETQVFVLVNDDTALDFTELTAVGMVDGKHQALNIPDNTGTPTQYPGSTTGPGYNEKGSPLQVSWSVRPMVAKVNINTVGDWFANNIFDEVDAHGVRNLVTNPKLLSSGG